MTRAKCKETPIRPVCCHSHNEYSLLLLHENSPSMINMALKTKEQITNRQRNYQWYRRIIFTKVWRHMLANWLCYWNWWNWLNWATPNFLYGRQESWLTFLLYHDSHSGFTKALRNAPSHLLPWTDDLASLPGDDACCFPWVRWVLWHGMDSTLTGDFDLHWLWQCWLCYWKRADSSSRDSVFTRRISDPVKIFRLEFRV